MNLNELANEFSDFKNYNFLWSERKRNFFGVHTSQVKFNIRDGMETCQKIPQNPGTLEF